MNEIDLSRPPTPLHSEPTWTLYDTLLYENRKERVESTTGWRYLPEDVRRDIWLAHIKRLLKR